MQEGDALIVFTKRAVLDIAGRLEREGIKTSVIYGMPRSVVKAGLADEELALSRIADCIVEKVGVENKD